MSGGEDEKGSIGHDARSSAQVELPVLSALLAQLTHELKTPLHSILSLATVLASEIDGALGDEQRKQVEMIRRNGEQLLELITELLSFSSIGARAHRFSLESFKLRALLEEIGAAIRVVARQKGIACQFDFSGASEEFISDRFLIRQVVTNLLQNAVKYSPEGGTVWCFAANDPNRRTLRLQVVDTGEGISPALQPAVFEGFVQGRGARSGVGLGLALVEASLRQLGGSIELRSEAGRGSLFEVLIPEAPEASATPEILVADADADTRATLRAVLKAAGYSVVEAGSEEEVVQGLNAGSARLALIDIALLSEALRSALAIDNRPPLIVSAAFDGQGERSFVKSWGADDFIAKPFDIDDLLRRIGEQLRRSREGDRPS